MIYSKGRYKVEMPTDLTTQLRIQKILIEGRCEWLATGKHLFESNVVYLFLEDGIITHSTSYGCFADARYNEVNWRDIVEPKPKDYEIF